MTRRTLLADALASIPRCLAATPAIRLEIGKPGIEALTVDAMLASIRSKLANHLIADWNVCAIASHYSGLSPAFAAPKI